MRGADDAHALLSHVRYRVHLVLLADFIHHDDLGPKFGTAPPEIALINT